MRRTWQKLRNLEIAPPWIPGLFQSLVYVIILALLGLLAMTFGLANQIWESLFGIAQEQSETAHAEAHAVTKSAHYVASGVCYVVGAPFFVFSAPFEAVGLAMHRPKSDAQTESLFFRLLGAGVFGIVLILWRLGWLPVIGDGVVWVLRLMVGVDPPLPQINATQE